MKGGLLVLFKSVIPHQASTLQNIILTCRMQKTKNNMYIFLCICNVHLSPELSTLCYRYQLLTYTYISVALFTKILTIKNCRKCKTKIKKSFTKILTIILSVKIVLTLHVKLPCPKCKILIVREILVLSFILSEKDGRCIGAST